MGLLSSLVSALGGSSHQRDRIKRQQAKAAQRASHEMLEGTTIEELHAKKRAEIDAALADPNISPADKATLEKARKLIS